MNEKAKNAAIRNEYFSRSDPVVKGKISPDSSDVILKNRSS